jgi:hypothetical protein
MAMAGASITKEVHAHGDSGAAGITQEIWYFYSARIEYPYSTTIQKLLHGITWLLNQGSGVLVLVLFLLALTARRVP